jgi:hypothetical protein
MSVAVDGQGLRIRSAMLETAGRIWSAPAPEGAEADPLVTFD